MNRELDENEIDASGAPHSGIRRHSPSYPVTEQLPLSPEMVLTAAREVVTHLHSLNKPYSADVMADCILTIENLLSRPAAQRPMDRDEIAKRISFAHLGDDREWKGFRSHADRFLAYALPSTKLGGAA
jgi:hypothetical protein